MFNIKKIKFPGIYILLQKPNSHPLRNKCAIELAMTQVITLLKMSSLPWALTQND